MVFVYRMLKGRRRCTQKYLIFCMLHLSKHFFFLFFDLFLNSAQLLSYSTGYLLTLSANFSSEWKPPSFFQLRCPVVAWKRWNVKKLFVLYLCICIYFCVASVYTVKCKRKRKNMNIFSFLAFAFAFALM